MSDTQIETTCIETSTEDKIVLEEVYDKEALGETIGTCKWLNDKLGFGFITICDGNDKGKDIFVHHSGINPLNSNYRTLKKGEYINFNVVSGQNGLQAIDVTGINGGPLMCDHIIGKKVTPVTSIPSIVTHQPQGKYNTNQWQTINTKKSKDKYNNVKSKTSYGLNQTKRFPPTNVTYKQVVQQTEN